MLEALTERAKELTCLYAIEESLREPDTDIDHVCERIIAAIPPGWQFPECCVAKITLEGREYRSPNFEENPWHLSVNIVQHDHEVGSIDVYYTREMPAADIGPFLKEEKKLIETIADRLNHFLTYKKMKHVFQEMRIGDQDLLGAGRGDWEAVLDIIRQTDNALFLRISNKMLNHLCWSGIDEAEALRREEKHKDMIVGNSHGDEISPHRPSKLLDFSAEFTQKIFQIASSHLSSDEILSRIQMWIQEDKLGTLLKTVRSRLPLSEVSSSLRRYFFTTREAAYNRYPLARGLKVLLIECILSNRIEYIERAKNHVDIEDLYHLLQNTIFSAESHGKLGGKSAGLFLAEQILRKTGRAGSLPKIQSPKTWYISSDMMLEFIHYNNMDEIIEQKYKDIERVRFEYPHIIDMFRQAVIPPEMVNKLSLALDDFGEKPIVVRSSSLLEDRTGLTFAGKYKSIFLGNQGPREERLRDLMKAIAEVYASNFGPEPIAYRAERDILEFSEQMGIMIQEVVGARVGSYYFPAYSGVLCSHNHIQWLPSVKDLGGIALVIPGLGTRAQDRSGEEHPLLIVPGSPCAEINGSAEEVVRHAPKKIDVINLETNKFETVELAPLLREFGATYPGVEHVISLYRNGTLQPLSRKQDAETPGDGELVATFEGLLSRSPFAMQIRNILRVLEKTLDMPVEVEFASDGERLFLLQCRPQCLIRVPRPAPIPKDIEREQVVFSANRFVSNGWASNITHIIYVDPAACAALDDPDQRREVADIVTRLNALLPKKQFILMRARRWSDSRNTAAVTIGDAYEFKNAAVLVELLPSNDSGDSAPLIDVRGLQTMVESGMLFLPVFPQDTDAYFNKLFLERSQNILSELLPEYAHLSGVVHVIDVPMIANGRVMQVLMNAELGEAVGMLADPEQEIGYPEIEDTFEDGQHENYWRWRYRMAEQIAGQLDPDLFGVSGFYVFGSTKNGTAGPASDIDLLIHFTGTPSQRENLGRWLEGWSLCLDEINYLRTGYRSGGLLDIHLIIDQDIADNTSYAVKINAVTDAARPLPMKQNDDNV
jgi:pyruvate,water dikinase